MKKVNDINQLIRDRAELILDRDITKFLKSLYGNPLFSHLENFKVVIDGDKKETIRDFFWYNDSTAISVLKEKLLNSYIEKESKSFIEAVDRIREDVDNLLNNAELKENY